MATSLCMNAQAWRQGVPQGCGGGFLLGFLSSCLRPCCQELDPVSSQTGEMEVRNPLFDHSTLSAPVPGPHSLPPLQ